MSEPILVAMDLIAQLALARGLNAQNKLCAMRVDEHWQVAVNGTRETQDYTAEGGWQARIKPFHCHVFFNGWLAGIMTPFDGVLAAGRLANVESFCSAIRAALAQEYPQA